MKHMTMKNVHVPASKFYADEERNKYREVGAIVDGRFYARGDADETIKALKNTWNEGSIGAMGDDRLRLVIDAPPYNDLSEVLDTRSLCWGGPKLTKSEFLTWHNSIEVCFDEAEFYLDWNEPTIAVECLQRCSAVIASRAFQALARALARHADDVFYENFCPEELRERYEAFKAEVVGA